MIDLVAWLHSLMSEGPLILYETPSIWQNCQKDFDPEKDFKYVNCVTNQPDQCELLKEMHRAKEFRTYFLAIIPIVVSVIAFVLNTIYLILQISMYRKSSSSYRKRYLFLISRSLSTLMALILFYVVIICWKTDGFQYASAMIFMVVGGLNFLSITGTYIALTCLLYTAVMHPLVYKVKITMRHCYGMIAFIWLAALAASIGVGMYGATLFYPDSAPVKCSFNGCQKPLAIIIVVSLSICYATVLGVYAILLIRLRMRYVSGGPRASQFSNTTTERQRSSLVAMNRLGMNMGTFAVGSVPILIVCIVALANLAHLSTLGEGQKSHCKTYLNGKTFVQVEILASIAAIVWLIAMILDPIINTVADQRLRHLLSATFTRTKASMRMRFSRVHSASVNTHANAAMTSSSAMTSPVGKPPSKRADDKAPLEIAAIECASEFDAQASPNTDSSSESL